MQIYARDHVEVHPQKKKEVLYLVKKTKNKAKQNKKLEQRNIIDIKCEVLLQEFNKYLFFIYNNAMDQLVTACMKAFVTNRKEQQFFLQYRIYSAIQ